MTEEEGKAFSFVEQPLLARNVVRYQGEPVVLVVAETVAQALDASEVVEIEYSSLPHIVDGKEAASPDSIKLKVCQVASPLKYVLFDPPVGTNPAVVFVKPL